MKKILAILVLVLFGTMSYAQWGTTGNDIYNTNTGNVGIGTTTPLFLLHAAKSMTEPQIVVNNLGSNGGATFRMIDVASGADWKFKSASTAAFKLRDQAMATDVITIERTLAAPNNGTLNALFIKANGNVGIGTANPTVKLAVNGKVNCKEVEVTITGWSDFVFKPGYKLRSLDEVESFINTNKHLPDVPSESTVLSQGTNLGAMDAILLQKIEELTLYVIDLKKQNDELQVKVKNLEK